MNFREKPMEYVFHTKQAAQAFAKAVAKKSDVRLDGKVSARKSKPENRGETSPGYSAHFKGIGLMDTAAAAKLAKQMGGRKYGMSYATPEYRAWAKMKPKSESVMNSDTVKLLESIRESLQEDEDALEEMDMPDDRDMYDELMMTAANEGKYYQKKDAAGAVKYAAQTMLNNYTREMRQTLRAISGKATAELKKRWNATPRKETKKDLQALMPPTIRRKR